MSDKKRRDITLGEMQDECKKYWNNGNIGSCGKCQYMEVCCHYEACTPAQLNLTDPPRFTEAQIAFLNGWHAVGAKTATSVSGTPVIYLNDENKSNIGVAIIASIANEIARNGETLDLAELLGKDA